MKTKNVDKLIFTVSFVKTLVCKLRCMGKSSAASLQQVTDVSATP